MSQRRILLTWISGWLLLVSGLAAAVPVAYRPQPGEGWADIAAKHDVSVAALREANLGQDSVGENWIRLPAKADLGPAPVLALVGSAQAEVREVVAAAAVERVYRMVGREFYVGTWEGLRIVAGGAGGNMVNAAIGTTVLLQHFPVEVLGFVGIAGGGGEVRVGDVIVASGAVQHDQGNWYDFATEGGEVVAGLSWYMRGQPLLSDAKRESRLVLVPDAALMERFRADVGELDLPLIGAEVAAFHGVERYRPRVIWDGWSTSGSQFVTSYHWREAVAQRVKLAAQQLALPEPTAVLIDQEDYAGVLAAEEHGVPWFIARVVVDLAAQQDAAAGVPMELYHRPEEIRAWLKAQAQDSHGKHFDWSYFYRQIELVLRPMARGLVAELSVPQDK